MTLIQLPIWAIGFSVLTGCGGGGGGSNGTIADGIVPTISSVSVSAPSSGKLTLSATASDNTGITGYCFTTTSTVPLANDSCFTATSNKTIDTPSTPLRYYTSVKDAANNVSAVFERVAGPCSAAGLAASNASVLPTVCMSTSLGEIVVALESTKAPKSSSNFLQYVYDGYYSGTVFHRVIANASNSLVSVIQGGGYTAVPISLTNTKAGTIYPAIELETPTATGLSNKKGTIAMARTSVLNSATREFFINTVDNLGFNTNGGGYAVFGNVISGLDTTVQAIRDVQVQANSSGEVSQPVTPPIIRWAYQLK